ncbi:MAG: hypothetical protein H6Q66_1116 [Firmicutes bacterium]|nr:hypothetical protein [Bacillota bacterium]
MARGGDIIKLTKSILLIVFVLLLSGNWFYSIAEAASLSASGVLKQGMSGAEVQLVQQKLKDYNYLNDAVDGIFGSATRSAVIAFQLDAGLEADGIVGAKTLQIMMDDRMMTSISRSRSDHRVGYQIAALAKQFLGTPYVWAGRSPNGFDCSGFVYYILQTNGVNVPRMADEQFAVGMVIHRQQELQIGDLVFFETYEPGPSHVGIFIGNGQFIHASSSANEVVITPMSKPYYQTRYLGARRLAR